jgi:hypothetical protein
MEDDLLREAIRALLQEKGEMIPMPKRLSGSIAYYKIKNPVGKIALIMPGINHPRYSPDMPKTVMEQAEGYLKDFSYVVPNGPGVSVAVALSAIDKDKQVDFNTTSERILIGHSAGGNNVLRYLAAGGGSMFRRIYLLDPTPSVTSLPPAIGAKTVLIHNYLNWSKPAERRTKFIELGKSIIASGGVAEENTMGHMAILDEGLRRAALGL